MFRRRQRKLDIVLGEKRLKGFGRVALAFRYANGQQAEEKPVRVEAGRRGTWEIIYTCGANPLRRGARIVVEIENAAGFAFDLNAQNWNEHGRGYVSVGSGAGCGPRLMLGKVESRRFAVVRLQKGELREGEQIRLLIGDTREGGQGCSTPCFSPQRVEVIAGVAPSGSRDCSPIDGSPLAIEITPGKRPRRYVVLAPSVVRPDEPFDLNVIALDENGNLCASRGPRMRFVSPPALEVAPTVFQQEGQHVFRGAVIDSEGLFRIELQEEEKHTAVESNPIACSPERGKRILWGDMGVEGARAEFPAPIDFRAVPYGVQPRPKERRGIVDFTRFSPERTDGKRDVLILREHKADASFEDMRRGVLSLVASDANRVLRRRSLSERPLLAEMASGSGNFEWLLQQALSRGHKAAAVGSSRCNRALPGLPRKILAEKEGEFGRRLNRSDSGYSGGGLTAVYAEDGTRDSIWQALLRRETYATTGARMIVRFDAAGHPMGSDMHLSGPPRFSIEVHGTAPIMRADIIRNQCVILSQEGNGKDLAFDHTDDFIPSGGSYYYLRVVQVDREFAWTSPIWIENRMRPGLIRPKHYPAWNTNESVILDEIPPNKAGPYLQELIDYLTAEGDALEFERITPVEVVSSAMGKYALFFAYRVKGYTPVSLKWFFECELPRLRVDAGWLEFGREEV